MSILDIGPELQGLGDIVHEFFAERVGNGVHNIDMTIGNMAVHHGELLEADPYDEALRRAFTPVDTITPAQTVIPPSPEVAQYEQQQGVQHPVAPQSMQVAQYEQQMSQDATIPPSAEVLAHAAKQYAQPSSEALQGFPRD